MSCNHESLSNQSLVVDSRSTHSSVGEVLTTRTITNMVPVVSSSNTLVLPTNGNGYVHNPINDQLMIHDQTTSMINDDHHSHHYRPNVIRIVSVIDNGGSNSDGQSFHCKCVCVSGNRLDCIDST